jgi:hypothetical protein
MGELVVANDGIDHGPFVSLGAKRAEPLIGISIWPMANRRTEFKQ